MAWVILPKLKSMAHLLHKHAVYGVSRKTLFCAMTVKEETFLLQFEEEPIILPLSHIRWEVRKNCFSPISKPISLSFMNAYSRYNKIKIDPLYAFKTTFMSNNYNYYYKVIPFKLNNACASYQKLMGDVHYKQILHTP